MRESSALRVAIPALGVGFAPIHYASEKGLFASESVEVKVMALEGGPACALALLSGEAELTYPLGPLIKHCMENGSKDFLAISGLNKQIGFSVIGDQRLSSIHSLRGGKIESPPSDWSGGTYLKYVLRHLGLQGEIELAYNYVTQEQRLEGLLNGEFQAGLLAAEKAIIAQEHGFKVILSFDEVIPGISGTAILTTPRLFRQNRDNLKRAIRAIHKGIRELQNRKHQSIQYLSNRFGLSLAAASTYHALHASNWSIDLNPTSIQEEIDIWRAVHPLPATIRATEIVEPSLVGEIRNLET